MPDYLGEPERPAIRTVTVGHDPMKHSLRPCPHCGALRLVRKRLAWYLRPCRRMGFQVKAYRCESCQRQTLRWRSNPE